jgi:hypothetical protein
MVSIAFPPAFWVSRIKISGTEALREKRTKKAKRETEKLTTNTHPRFHGGRHRHFLRVLPYDCYQ